MKRQYPHDSLDRWELLINRKPFHISLIKSIYSYNRGSIQDYNPFNCKDLVVPSTSQIVGRMIDEKSKEWEELDSRMLINDCGTYTSESDYFNTMERPPNENFEISHHTKNTLKNTNRTYYQPGLNPYYVSVTSMRHKDQTMINNVGEKKKEEKNFQNKFNLIIPPLFKSDYSCAILGRYKNRSRLLDVFNITPRSQISGVQVLRNQASKLSFQYPRKRRKQVLNLNEPSGVLDYEEELGHLFNSVPSEYDIKVATENKVESIAQFIPNILTIKKEIEEGLKDFTRLDGHALSRIRRKDRHHLPRLMKMNSTVSSKTNIRLSEISNQDKLHKIFGLNGVNIRLECWKKGLKRGTASDVHRMELEFFGDQTLYDIHRTIIYASRDDLFLNGVKEMQYVKRNEGDVLPWRDDENFAPRSQVNVNSIEDSCSGMFLIEDTCYITGDVDYASPVLQWLEDESNDKNILSFRSRLPSKGIYIKSKTVFQKNSYNESNSRISRREYLHIPLPSSKVPVKKMEDTRIDSIPLRLNVRYVHVCNGDIECAIFFSDIRMRLCDEEFKKEDYPLCHDIWISPHPLVMCEGCQRLPACLITTENNLVDEGIAYLCVQCYQLLHYRCVETLDIRKENIERVRKLLIRKNRFHIYPLSILQDRLYSTTDCNELDALF